MDSLTQAVLGAAVGEAVLGKKVGNKAAVWGAVAGTLPDLDVVLNLFLNDIDQLVFHRSITHSFVFAMVLSPVLGKLIFRFYRDGPATWRDWSWLSFAVLFTHPLLDCFTTYGTQVFQPFSNYPVSFHSIFVIDPLYTLPLIVGLLLALRRRPPASKRRRANYLGLSLSCLYLLLSVVIKIHVTSVFTEALGQQGLAYERIATRVSAIEQMPFSTNLDGTAWRPLVERIGGR